MKTVEEISILDLQGWLSEGLRSSQDITAEYLQRISEIDQKGPELNSVIELNPDAMQIARDLDAECSVRGPRSALHGIPILIKDNIDTADKMMTTAGSLALEGSVALRDAHLVEKLRQAGAVLLGKTNLSEWANFRSTCSISGWSSRGGQTKNPYALDRTPCGSSSGSAVAVAANLCAGAIGTETDGSVMCPSHVNAVVGIKPTLGLVSRSGIIPIAHSQDTAGPMAKNVTDAALLLGAIVAVDPRDPATQNNDRAHHDDYTQYLDANGLEGARIGVARNLFGANPHVDQIIEESIALMAAQGAEVVDPADIPNAKEMWTAELEVLLFEFKADLNTYLRGLPSNFPVRSLDQLIAFNERNADRVMPFFGQERLLAAAERGDLEEEAYVDALEKCHRLSRTEGLDAVLQAHSLDAVVAPSGRPAWLIDPINGDMGSGGSSTPAAVAGYPSVTVPAGQVSGLPVGVSFIGGAFSEPVLIRLAYAFEQATQARRSPQYLATIDMGRPETA
jgi:amidase